MFFHFPIWANWLFLVLALVVKYIVVDQIEKTAWYNTTTSGKTWMPQVLIVAGLNAIVTIGILFFLVGLFWAIVLGFIDFAIHFLVGYWKQKHKLPTVSAGNVVVAKGWFKKLLSYAGAIHVTSYLGIASSVMGLMTNKGTGTIIHMLLSFFTKTPAA